VQARHVLQCDPSSPDGAHPDGIGAAADAAQNGMAKEYRSVTEGVMLVAMIIGWDYALDWLGYRFPAFQRLNAPSRPATLSSKRLSSFRLASSRSLPTGASVGPP